MTDVMKQLLQIEETRRGERLAYRLAVEAVAGVDEFRDQLWCRLLCKSNDLTWYIFPRIRDHSSPMLIRQYAARLSKVRDEIRHQKRKVINYRTEIENLQEEVVRLRAWSEWFYKTLEENGLYNSPVSASYREEYPDEECDV